MLSIAQLYIHYGSGLKGGGRGRGGEGKGVRGRGYGEGRRGEGERVGGRGRGKEGGKGEGVGRIAESAERGNLCLHLIGFMRSGGPEIQIRVIMVRQLKQGIESRDCLRKLYFTTKFVRLKQQARVLEERNFV